jgi:hypothetical protein
MPHGPRQSENHVLATTIIHHARTIGRALQRNYGEEWVSQFVWLASVVVFAGWTLTHYQAPPGAIPWIGMTIRCSVFAIGGQVVRTWLALRWEDYHAHNSDRERID